MKYYTKQFIGNEKKNDTNNGFHFEGIYRPHSYLLACGRKTLPSKFRESWCVTSHFMCCKYDPKNVSFDNRRY